MSAAGIGSRSISVSRYGVTHVIAVPVALAAAALFFRDSGWDLRIEDQFFDPVFNGFPMRRSGWFEAIGHDLLKMLPIGIGLLALAAAIASPWLTPLRRWRAILWSVFAAMCIGPGLITALKQVTAAHCPWDLARYGGYAEYVHTWFATSRADSGRCLPSGHAGAGFSLLALYFAGWASGHAGWRWWGLAIGVVAGIVFSVVRTVQGAHFVSHSLWSALIDWLVASLVFLPLIVARAHKFIEAAPLR